MRSVVFIMLAATCVLSMHAAALLAADTERDERPLFRVHVKFIEVSRTALAATGIRSDEISALTPAQLRIPNVTAWGNPVRVDDDGAALRRLDAWLKSPQKYVRVMRQDNLLTRSGDPLTIRLPDGPFDASNDEAAAADSEAQRPHSSLRLCLTVQDDGLLRLRSDQQNWTYVNGTLIPGLSTHEKVGEAMIAPGQHALMVGIKELRAADAKNGKRSPEVVEQMIQISFGAVAPQVPKAATAATSEAPVVRVTAVAPIASAQAEANSVTFAGPPIPKYSGPESLVHVRVIELSRDPPTSERPASNFDESALRDLIGMHHEFRNMHFPTVRIGPGDPIKTRIESWLAGPTPRARVVREQTLGTSGGHTQLFDAFEGYPEFQLYDRTLGGSTPERRITTQLFFCAQREDDGRQRFRAISHFRRPKAEDGIPTLNDWRDLSIDAFMAPKQSIVIAGITRARAVEPKAKFPLFAKEQLEHYEILIEMTPELLSTGDDSHKAQVEAAARLGLAPPP